MRKVLVIAALMLCAFVTVAQNEKSQSLAPSSHGKGRVVVVAGTEQARLESVLEVLKQLPGVTVIGSDIQVIGRGVPAIYIGTRKVTDLSELASTHPSRVKDIEIIRYPGVEYDKKVAAVIVIRFNPDDAEGFRLDNLLRLDQSRRLSPGEELTLGWRRRGLRLGTFVAWNREAKYIPRQQFTNKYRDHHLVSESVETVHPDVRKAWLATRFTLDYDIDQSHKITLNYAYYDRYKNLSWNREKATLGKEPQRRHDVAVELLRRYGHWDVVLGNNTYFDHQDQIDCGPSSQNNDLRREYDLRTYLRAMRSMGTGSLTFGAEHEYNHIDLNVYEDDPSYNQLQNLYYKTHAEHPDNTLAAYVALVQHWGKCDVEAGLRYEYNDNAYRPYGDDGLKNYVEDFGPHINVPVPEEYHLLAELLGDGEVSHHSRHLLPSLKVRVPIADSRLTLQYSQQTAKPYLGIMRLRFTDIAFVNTKTLNRELASTASVDWNYKDWSVGASYSHYDDPICTTFSGMNQYNAPDYDAVDLSLILSPKVGKWSGNIQGYVHKQWFYMPLANGKDKLRRPWATVRCNNTLTLPYDWMVVLGAQWYSKGAYRNHYYYDSDLKIDAALQKAFPRQGLTITLSVDNLLRNSYDDITKYVQEFYGLSQGRRDRKPRVMSLGVRWRI